MTNPYLERYPLADPELVLSMVELNPDGDVEELTRNAHNRVKEIQGRKEEYLKSLTKKFHA